MDEAERRLLTHGRIAGAIGSGVPTFELVLLPRVCIGPGEGDPIEMQKLILKFDNIDDGVAFLEALREWPSAWYRKRKRESF